MQKQKNPCAKGQGSRYGLKCAVEGMESTSAVKYHVKQFNVVGSSKKLFFEGKGKNTQEKAKIPGNATEWEGKRMPCDLFGGSLD